MMKKTYRFMAAALLITGALLTTACSNDDEAVNNPEGQSAARSFLFTATLAPKHADGDQTRAISVNDQGTANETLTTTWAEGEQIAVYYKKGDGSYATAIASVGAPNSDGTASITATLEDAADQTIVSFVYPASLHNGKGGIDDAKLRMNQHGTIADISANFDGATGYSTLVTDGTSFSTTASTIKLENELLIGKFIPQVSGSPITGIKRLTVAYYSGVYTATPSGTETFGTDGIYIAMRHVNNDEATTIIAVTADKTYRFTKKVTLDKGKFYRNLVIPMTESSRTVDLSKFSDSDIYVAEDGETLSGTAPANFYLLIVSGATVTLSGVKNDLLNNGSFYDYPGIECKGNATIVLAEGTMNTLTGSANPGLKAGPTGTTLTIQGLGTLVATGGNSSSGIGSDRNDVCGNIIISDGMITATGGNNAAGIGSGAGQAGGNSSCGDITISGGTVTATGGNDAAGIGSGFGGHRGNSSCGTITISCGTVTATAGNKAAGIGSGDGEAGGNSRCGTITISGGTVTAQCGQENGNHAAIGCGYDGTCDDITLNTSITSITLKKSDANQYFIGGPVGHRGTVRINNYEYSSDDLKSGRDGRFIVFSCSLTDGGKTWTLVP